MKRLAFLLMLSLLVLTVILGQSARDNLGAAMAVGAIFGVAAAVPIVLLVAIVARNGLHIHLHRHGQPGRLRKPIDADAKMIEGPTQVTVTKN